MLKSVNFFRDYHTVTTLMLILIVLLANMAVSFIACYL